MITVITNNETNQRLFSLRIKVILPSIRKLLLPLHSLYLMRFLFVRPGICCLFHTHLAMDALCLDSVLPAAGYAPASPVTVRPCRTHTISLVKIQFHRGDIHRGHTNLKSQAFYH